MAIPGWLQTAGGIGNAISPWFSMGWAGISSALSARSQRKANEENIGLSREMMDWQERMANTAHQREVADLRAAGLNPILSATGGRGSPMPSGSFGDVKSEFQGAEIDGLVPLQSAQMMAQTKKTNADADLTREQIRTERKQQKFIEAQTQVTAGGQLGLLGTKIPISNIEKRIYNEADKLVAPLVKGYWDAKSYVRDMKNAYQRRRQRGQSWI